MEIPTKDNKKNINYTSCNKCKRKISNFNLSIYHNCNCDIPSNIWDTKEDDNYYCYNPFKNINISKFYKQITFVNKIPKKGFLSDLENKGQFILELLLKNFFDFTNLSSYEKLILFNSSFSDEGGQNLEKILQKLKSLDKDIDKIIMNEIKIFILDIYYLVISILKSDTIEKRKEFFSVFIKYKEENPNYYKNNIINFFKEKIIKEEKIKIYISNNYTINEYLYLPRDVKVIYNIKNKYLLLSLNFISNLLLLYSIDKKQIINSYKIRDLKKINDYNYIGINEKKELVKIKVKINPFNDSDTFEINSFFKFDEKESKSIDFNYNILTNNKLIYLDKLHNITLMILKPNNESFIYKSFNYEIKEYKNKRKEMYRKIILVDKINNQIAIEFIYSYFGIITFYDFELNFKKSLKIQENVYTVNFSLFLLNKNLYILFGQNKIYLINTKYLEIVSQYNNNLIERDCSIFTFFNSNEFFVQKVDFNLIYHYKLICNELILHETSSDLVNKKKLMELKEINNNGDYSILYRDESISYLKYYIKNNITENYLYPNFKNKENDKIAYYEINKYYNDCFKKKNNSYSEPFSQQDYKDSLEYEENFENLNNKKIPINFELFHNYIIFNENNKIIENEWIPWIPLTKLGKISKILNGGGCILPKIFYFSIPIKEEKIVDIYFDNHSHHKLKEECISIKKIGNRNDKKNKFKAIVIIGDLNGIVGLGIKASKDINTAIIEAGKDARLNIISVRRGFFKKPEYEVYTIANRVEGKSGSVKVQLIPAPRGTGLPVPKEAKKLFQYAGIKDIIMKSFGNKNNVENLLQAIYNAFIQTYKKNDLSLILDDFNPLMGMIEEYQNELKNYHY